MFKRANVVKQFFSFMLMDLTQSCENLKKQKGKKKGMCPFNMIAGMETNLSSPLTKTYTIGSMVLMPLGFSWTIPPIFLGLQCAGWRLTSQPPKEPGPPTKYPSAISLENGYFQKLYIGCHPYLSYSIFTFKRCFLTTCLSNTTL